MKVHHWLCDTQMNNETAVLLRHFLPSGLRGFLLSPSNTVSVVSGEQYSKHASVWNMDNEQWSRCPWPPCFRNTYAGYMDVEYAHYQRRKTLKAALQRLIILFKEGRIDYIQNVPAVEYNTIIHYGTVGCTTSPWDRPVVCARSTTRLPAPAVYHNANPLSSPGVIILEPYPVQVG